MNIWSLPWALGLSLAILLSGCSVPRQFHEEPGLAQEGLSATVEPTTPALTSPILEGDIGLESDVGVRFAWALEIGEANLAGASFQTFFPRSWLLRTRDNRYVNMSPRWVGQTGRNLADGLQSLRVGPTIESVGGLSGERNRSLPPIMPPRIHGYRFIGATRLVFRPGSPDYIGLWRSEIGDRTLIAAFDNDTRTFADGAPYQIVAFTAFEASVISTNGSYHQEQPTWLVLASDPNEAGDFGLVMLHWPKILRP